MADPKIIDRIEKLIALAVGSNHENEARNAAYQAVRLIKDNQIELGGRERIVYVDRIVYRDPPQPSAPPHRAPPPRNYDDEVDDDWIGVTPEPFTPPPRPRPRPSRSTLKRDYQGQTWRAYPRSSFTTTCRVCHQFIEEGTPVYWRKDSTGRSWSVHPPCWDREYATAPKPQPAPAPTKCKPSEHSDSISEEYLNDLFKDVD